MNNIKRISSIILAVILMLGLMAPAAQATPEPGESTIVSVPQKPQVGKILLTIFNADPGLGDHSLAGATFEILNSEGIRIEKISTDSDGKGTSPPLPLGEYALRQIVAPEGFLLNPDVFPVALEYGNQEEDVVYADVTVPQQPLQPEEVEGKIRVVKYNANPAMGDYSLEGAVFEIFRSADRVLVDTVVTGADGVAESELLPPGEYLVVEKNAPYGFVRDKTERHVQLNMR